MRLSRHRKRRNGNEGKRTQSDLLRRKPGRGGRTVAEGKRHAGKRRKGKSRERTG